MVRWVVCLFAAGLACTMSNPLFVVDDEQTTGGAGGPSTTAPATADPSSTDGTAASDTTGDPGPCQDVCGTRGCGACPDADMVAYPGFEIDAREVRNGEYQQFLAAGQDPAMQPDECAWNDDYTPRTWPVVNPALPVVEIDWCDARAYCAWAGQRLCGATSGGPAPLLTVFDPAVNQWYRACSNGDYRNYPYGDIYDKFACNGADALLDGLLGVGSLPGCEAPIAGVYDLSGNVWEWVDSCLGDGPDAECMRRGGSYFSDPEALRCDLLSTRPRSTALNHVGVRCCSI